MAELTTVPSLLTRSTKRYGERIAFCQPQANGKVVQVTYNQFAADVAALATYLMGRSKITKKVGVIGRNSYQWAVVYFAVMSSGGTIVPLDKALTTEELIDSIDRVNLDVLFYADDVQAKARVASRKRSSTTFVSMHGKATADSLLFYLQTGKQMLEQGETKMTRVKIIPDACAALLFTSGTTSRSKIVMLSQKSIMLDMQRGVRPFQITPEDVFLSILPMHHMFECNAGFLAPLYSGSTIYFSQGIRHVGSEFKTVKPTVVICVPRVIDSLHDKIWKGIRAKGKERVVRSLIKLTALAGTAAPGLRRRLFSAVHQELGGRVRIFLSGAAPLNNKIAREMIGLGFGLFQGYGLTECSPAVALTYVGNNDIDSVGPPIAGTKIQIANKGDDGVGEVMIKGSQVMLGYYKDAAATRKVLQGGFFATGDLGFIKSNGSLKIVGRLKNMIVTSNGKKIYPEEIETLIARHPAIRDVVVHEVTSKFGPQVCASVVLADATSKTQKNLFAKQAKEHIAQVNQRLADYEQIQKIDIRDDDFVRTSTLKVKRHLIKHRQFER